MRMSERTHKSKPEGSVTYSVQPYFSICLRAKDETWLPWVSLILDPMDFKVFEVTIIPAIQDKCAVSREISWSFQSVGQEIVLCNKDG
jgi:hypothetical protein